MSWRRFNNDGVSFFAPLPSSWREERIYDVVELRTSNVDKKSDDGEKPVRLCNYIDVYNNDKITMSLDFMEATATEAQIERFALQVGDVVITKDSEAPDDIGVPTLVSETAADLVCGYHLTILRPNLGEITGSYLFYSLASRVSAYQFFLVANGVTRFGLTYQGTKGVRIAFPPLAEQQQIAAFLDWKTMQTDTLIARKKELLEKLREKRLAVITQAVTRGLNPAATLRDSGVPLLGQVPAHWEVKRLRFLVHRIDQGWSPKANNFEASEGELGVLKLSAVHAGKFYPDENKMLEEVPEGQAIHTPQRHDVLVTRANTPELVGDACSVSGDFPDMIIPDLIYRLKVDLGISEERFICLFLLSKQGRAQIESNARGSNGSMVKLGQGHLKNFQFPCPPQEEQREIADYVDDQTTKIDVMIEMVNEAIGRLSEYRTALITAATAGRIDVQRVQIPQPAA